MLMIDRRRQVWTELEIVFGQAYPKLETILADDGSTGGDERDAESGCSVLRQ